MNPLAAIRTVAHPLPQPRQPAARCAFVEDLNWPSATPAPDRKKSPRPTDVWVPGPDGFWRSTPPTLQ